MVCRAQSARAGIYGLCGGGGKSLLLKDYFACMEVFAKILRALLRRFLLKFSAIFCDFFVTHPARVTYGYQTHTQAGNGKDAGVALASGWRAFLSPPMARGVPHFFLHYRDIR